MPPRIKGTVLDRLPREDRSRDRMVSEGFGGDKLRAAIARACTGVGVLNFLPHDLRRGKISFLHVGDVRWAWIGEHVGRRNLAVTASTYAHLLVDKNELDYAGLLR